MAVYTANHASDRAASLTNQQKKDLWLQRWSEVSGSNMVGYMVDRWKLEVSQAAIDAVEAMRGGSGQPLPDWMPLASSLSELGVRSGLATNLDIGAAGSSLDGTATLVGVGAPTHGTLTGLGGGTYTYQSVPGYVGDDSFTATYQSSAGNTQTFTTAITVNHGLSSSWKMDEGSGSTVADSGLARATGTLQGSPEWVPGQSGSAIQLDGVDDRIEFGTAPALDGTIDFTLAAWIRTTATASGMIVQQRDGINGQYMFKLNGNGTLHFWIYNGGFQFDFNTVQTVNDGLWHRVVAMREGEEGRIYIDGQLAGTASGPLRALDAGLPVAVGYDLRDNNTYFNGAIDDVRIYTYAIDVGFDEWIQNFYPGESDPVTIGGGADPNGDLVSNHAAFIQAGSPSAYLPETLPELGGDPDYFIVEFRRSDRAAHLGPVLQYGVELESWDTAIHGIDGVVIDVLDDGFGSDFGGIGIDKVTVKIPRAGRPRLFIQLATSVSSP